MKWGQRVIGNENESFECFEKKKIWFVRLSSLFTSNSPVIREMNQPTIKRIPILRYCIAIVDINFYFNYCLVLVTSLVRIDRIENVWEKKSTKSTTATEVTTNEEKKLYEFIYFFFFSMTRTCNKVSQSHWR